MQLPWLEPGDPLPPASGAWGSGDPIPGLLAAGGALDVDSLRRAYAGGVFPWYGEGQPILWWSPDPRMVLQVAHYRLHRSLRKTLARFRTDADCQIRIDHDFSAVIRACAQVPRDGQSGTWIVPDMVRAYVALHRAGLAHSVETWIGGELVGGLYCVALGRAVFGESMFTHRADASKIALAALVGLCRHQGAALIDCQQHTAHLSSQGAREIPRARFLRHVASACRQPGLDWRFDPVYWNEFFAPAPPAAPT